MSITRSKEIWKPVYQYKGKYEVSSLGRVKSLPWMRRVYTKMLGIRIDKRHGYPYVDLWKDGLSCRYYIHTLVLTAFRGPRKLGYEACHTDDVKINCQLSNLSWGTRSKNNLQAYANGKRKRIFAYEGYVPPTAFGGFRSNAYHVIGKMCKDGKFAR